MAKGRAKKQKKAGSGLQFYPDLSKVVANSRMVSKEVKSLRKTLVYWFGEENGFLFNRTAAENLANYMREKLLSGEAFYSGAHRRFAKLSDYWLGRKEKMGLELEMGVATGSMANAIKAVRAGYSEFKVGISGREQSSQKIGSSTNIAEYAYWLEHGRDYVKGGGEQPPRPWFGTLFIEWADDNLPELAKTTYGKDLRARINALTEKSKEMGGMYGGGIDESTAWSTFHGEAVPEELEGSEVAETYYGEIGGPDEFTAEEWEIPAGREEADVDRQPKTRGLLEGERDLGVDPELGFNISSFNRFFNKQTGLWEDMIEYYNKKFGTDF